MSVSNLDRLRLLFGGTGDGASPEQQQQMQELERQIDALRNSSHDLSCPTTPAAKKVAALHRSRQELADQVTIQQLTQRGDHAAAALHASLAPNRQQAMLDRLREQVIDEALYVRRIGEYDVAGVRAMLDNYLLKLQQVGDRLLQDEHGLLGELRKRVKRDAPFGWL